MPESLAVSVERVNHASHGGAVFVGRTSDGRKVRVVAKANALLRAPVPGETWTVSGDVRDHPKYGKQFYAERGSYHPPRGRLLISFLASNPAFSGVGEVRARALYEAFGDGLAAVLDGADVDALARAIPRPLAEQLADAWVEQQAEMALVLQLDALGFDVRLANKLLRVWGTKALDMLKANPYYMLAFAGWSVTDAAAMKLGVAVDDERRLVGAVEAALYARLLEAHTLTSHAVLVKLVKQRLGSSNTEEAIKLAAREGALVGSHDFGYQAIGAAALEARIAERIRAMLSNECPIQPSLLSSDTEEATLKAAIQDSEHAQRIRLNAEQRDAVMSAMRNAFCLVTGGAGVGKTTVIRTINDVARRRHINVVQMALAGRAARRMEEATGSPAMTIARFLHDAKNGQLALTSDTLVIVDEASMLDLPTMYRLLRFLPDGAHLVLVGDAAQLPPIGFGLVFHRLVTSPSVPRTELKQVHRQAESTGLPAIAALMRNHRMPVLNAYTGKSVGVSVIDCQPHEVMRELARVARDWSGDEWKALGAVKSGANGIVAINTYFHAARSAAEAEPHRFVAGEPVIHLVNDYERGLMNGSLGQVLEIHAGDEGGLTVDFEGEHHFLTHAEVEERLELAYAISVHKAQGSQLKRVAIVIHKTRLLDHALVYTALTRGVEQVVFVGDVNALAQAVQGSAHSELRSVAFSL